MRKLSIWFFCKIFAWSLEVGTVLIMIIIIIIIPGVFPVFLYSMPGYKCSIRERMLYSSCRNPLVDTVENHLGIDIAKKVRRCPRARLHTAALKTSLTITMK